MIPEYRPKKGGFLGWLKRQQNIGAAMILGVFLAAGVGENYHFHEQELQKLDKAIITYVNGQRAIQKDFEQFRDASFRPPMPAQTNIIGQASDPTNSMAK